MHRQYMYDGFEYSFWMYLIPVILLLLIAIAIYMIVKNNKRNNQLSEWGDYQSRNNAREILDERYAKGEIDDEEYKRIKNNLTNS